VPLNEAVAERGPGEEVEGYGVFCAGLCGTGGWVRRCWGREGGRDIPRSQPLWDFLELFFRCVKIVLNSFVNHCPLSFVSHKVFDSPSIT
jgi:hypothetical protein